MLLSGGRGYSAAKAAQIAMWDCRAAGLGKPEEGFSPRVYQLSTTALWRWNKAGSLQAQIALTVKNLFCAGWERAAYHLRIYLNILKQLQKITLLRTQDAVRCAIF